MATLATYVAFMNREAKSAFEHYHDILGGDLEIITAEQMPMPGVELPPDAVMHAVLTLPGGVIAGSDAMPGETYNVRDSVYSFLYTVDSVDDATRIIDQFVAAGGEVNMPFELAPWGDHYGQVFDRFGVMWAIVVEGVPAEA